ncbi:uncharacterized protein EI90DRAFT_3064354, partial [Cantharellus anzutake]|uniref:uncharacterized protein n=1 Tax=Cantharellus anzutake TaxID=1750568 RepID=UPI0019064A3B
MSKPLDLKRAGRYKKPPQKRRRWGRWRVMMKTTESSSKKRQQKRLQETRHEPKNERHHKHPGSNLQRVTKANCLIQCKTEYSTTQTT